MEFEYDPEKSRANRTKHGIDFEQARLLWQDERRLVVPARTRDEPRFAIIALLVGKLWTGIFTVREERVRIISVRRARTDEEENYHLG